MSVEPHDETTHAKPRPSDKRKGLLADRFRPGPLIEHDAIRTSHEAIDEADGSKVVVHFLADRFASSAAMRRETVARLLDRVGHGNRFVSPLVEAGIERDRIFVVEPRASGVSLRNVLRGRARSRKVLEPRELLPVVARLRAALEALPDGYVLGRIAPRTVHVDPEELRVSECFVLPALDRDALVALFAEDEALRAGHAPECARGEITAASDLFAVGALLHEALAFAPIGGDVTASLGALDRDVRALLHAKPAARPSLDGIVEHLASLAELRVPELEASPFELEPGKRAARLAAFEETLVADDLDVLEDDDDAPVVRDEDKTRQIAMRDVRPVIDELADQAPTGRLPAPAIDIEAAPIATSRADAPKAPPPARRSRPLGKGAARDEDARLPAPKSVPPAPRIDGPETGVVLPEPKRLIDTTPSVEIAITPVPPRGDVTDRIRESRKRPGETTLQLRALEDPDARVAPSRGGRRRGPRLVLIAMILAGAIIALALGLAYVQKRSEEAEHRERIQRRLEQLREGD